MSTTHKKTWIITICVALLFLTMQLDQIASAEKDEEHKLVKSSTIAKWTYLVYASVDASIGKSVVKNDSQHLIDVMKNIGSDGKINIVMLLDTMYPKDETRFYYFTEGNIVNLSWDENDSDMGNKDTLVKFINRVKKDFPAENYVLSISSPRGMGWQGICLDDGTAKARTQSLFGLKYIDMPELSSALREVTNNGREKIDVMEFITCITGSLEVAYQISPYVKYMVASEENMQSFTSNLEYAWPLNKSLSSLKNNTNMTAEEYAKCVVHNFKAGKNTSAYIGCTPFKKKANIPVDTTLAATNLSKLNELAASVDTLASSLIDNMPEYKEKIKKSRSEARKFGPWYPRTRLGYALYLPIVRKTMGKIGIPFFMDIWVDPYHFSELLCDKITADDPDSEKIINACHGVMDAINNTIIANNVSEGDNAHGLHIYFPPNGFRYNQNLWLIGFPNILISKKAYASYENLDFARTTSWNEMLYKTYGIPDVLVDLWLKHKMPVL